MQEFLRLSKAMLENRATEPGPRPPNMINRQWSFLTPVVLDSVPSGSLGSHGSHCAGPAYICTTETLPMTAYDLVHLVSLCWNLQSCEAVAPVWGLRPLCKVCDSELCQILF